MPRSLAELQQDIATVKRQLASLPHWAIREGLDEDCLGVLDALEAEAKEIEKLVV